jgi:hypothetical protein
MTTFYRLRPEHARTQPAFRLGESYAFLRQDSVPGYLFLELNGKPRCVPERDFERIAESADAARGEPE